MFLDVALILLSMFPQGVEFFDEKLNTLCMAWLIDHGKKQVFVLLMHLHKYIILRNCLQGKH